MADLQLYKVMGWTQKHYNSIIVKIIAIILLAFETC